MVTILGSNVRVLLLPHISPQRKEIGSRAEHTRLVTAGMLPFVKEDHVRMFAGFPDIQEFRWSS